MSDPNSNLRYLPGHEPESSDDGPGADVLMHPTFDRIDDVKDAKRPNYLLRRVVAGSVGALALIGIAAGIDWTKDKVAPALSGLFEDRPDVDPATLTVKYDPAPNESINAIAERHTPDDESMEPLRNELSRQAAQDGQPGIQNNETLMVPEYQDPKPADEPQSQS